MRRSANLRVTRCESDDQTCTHCGTCRSKNKISLLNLPKRFVPVGGGKSARWRVDASNVLGNMTYPCNNIHPDIWAAQPQYAGMSLDASNIITNLVICFLGRKMLIQPIRSHDITYFGSRDMMGSIMDDSSVTTLLL
jgi:hypothetical protein